MLALITEAKKRADELAAVEKKKAEDAEKAHLLAIEQQQQQDEAAARAADEERNQRREKIFNEERALLTMAADWQAEAENGKMEESENKIALLLSHLTDLLATCIAQQEDIHNLDDVVQMQNQVFDQVNSRLEQLEQTVATPVASSSNTSDRLEALEIDVGSLKDGVQLQQTTTQQLEQRICIAATHSRSEPRETTPKFDDQEIFCDSTKTDPIPWFCKFELKLQLHHVSEHKHHAICAHLHTYLSFYAPPTSPTDDEVAVGDILTYVTKVAREFRKQRYDDNNAPLLYVHIQVGQASCSALLASGASRNFMSQAFMQRAGLGTQVPRKANATAIKLANGRTQQLIDCYIEAVPVYFAPHACEPVTFDILDTDFDVILGMPWLASADHTVNFHRGTLTVRDAFGDEVSCTIPLPHPSIRCQVVTTKALRATCSYEKPDKMGLCFLRTVALADSSPTDLSSDPRVVRLLDEFADIFESATGVVSDRPISHEIILEAGVVPPKGCIYRMSEEELTVLRTQLDHLLDKGWIHPSSSPYGALVLFVRKKNKDLRLCIDYRKLNAQPIKNVGPLPRIDDLLERLGDTKYFSKLDLKSGYHQISTRPNDRYKSAFKTRYGHFEWVVIHFGLTNAPTTFQAAMTNELRAMLDRFMLVYLDGILVYSRILEDHLEHLRRVLKAFRRAKYKANRDKCEFVRQELEYLGHFVTQESISPLAGKIQAIQEWSEPRNVMDVRSFLGLAGYYQRFIKGYSKIAAHLTKLQCEDRPFDFGEDAWESFLALKTALLSVEVLRIYDPLLPTLVTTDASDYEIGVVLEQHDGVD
ncbi:hypothetical protein CBR_g8304 [Chara braunii]|nr:hypothetical protein CBR_g8304 [Chara braunii]|eukprot:GBG71006.1 hypothetical protein CBR_g8304 [Chara braunii]